MVRLSVCIARAMRGLTHDNGHDRSSEDRGVYDFHEPEYTADARENSRCNCKCRRPGEVLDRDVNRIIEVECRHRVIQIIVERSDCHF